MITDEQLSIAAKSLRIRKLEDLLVQVLSKKYEELPVKLVNKISTALKYRSTNHTRIRRD